MDGFQPKHCVVLAAETRSRLESLTRNGSNPAKKILHARILLMADRDHPAGRYRDAQIAKTLGVHENTVANVRRKFALAGEQTALDRKPRLTPPVPPKLDGAKEAALIAICCSPPPDGRTRWTMSLLADELIRRKIVVSISVEAVRLRLKKTNFSLGEPNGSASRRKTPRVLSPRWSKSWTSMLNRSRRTSR